MTSDNGHNPIVLRLSPEMHDELVKFTAEQRITVEEAARPILEGELDRPVHGDDDGVEGQL